jgi:nicotinate dehydrogenase subunit B
MTGLLHEKEFSRKSLLKGGGALVVGFSLAGSALAGKASAATAPNDPVPSAAGYLPNQATVDAWLRLNADNTVTVTSGQGEWGQGTPTALLMIVAEEMNMSMSQMSYNKVDSWVEAIGGGGASAGITQRALPVRAAAAYAYQALLGLASTKLNVPVSSLTVANGVVSGGGQSVSYGALLGGQLFNVVMPAATSTLNAGVAPAKPVANYSLVGTSPQRIDIPAKVTGTYTYVQSIRLPGMLHGRVVRPRGQGGVTSVDNQPQSVDPTSIAHIPGAQVVQINNFLSVVAPKEYDAIQAAAELKVVWKSDPILAGTGNFWETCRAQDAAGLCLSVYSSAASTGNAATPGDGQSGNVPAALASAAKVISATYTYEFNGHMSIGPTCAVADVTSTGATIFCNAQTISGVPTTLAPILNLPAQNIRAFYVEGSSSYGGNPTTDVYTAAAVMSQKVGAPVRLQFMRWDEHGWDNYSPATIYDVRAGIDGSGNWTAVDWTTYGQANSGLVPTNELIGAGTWPAVAPQGKQATSADQMYKVSSLNKRLLVKSLPMYQGGFRSAFFRSPNAPQAHFAAEQIVDELAYAANMDPIAFRRQNIDGTTVYGARWLSVLDAATMAAGWTPAVANSVKQTGTVRTGRGFSFGIFGNTQVATVAEIEVNMKSGKILAKQLYIASNHGITMSPGLVANQIEGGSIMGLSRALHEQIVFSKERVTSLDWVTYPILRFADTPKVTTIVVAPGAALTVVPGAENSIAAGNTAAFAQGWLTTGGGEAGVPGPVGAVANAFFDATGVRIRQSPMTPARVRATLAADGAGTAGVA